MITKPTDFEAGFVEGLRRDHDKLIALYEEWDAVKEDPKLDEFLNRLKSELCNRKINHEGKKLVIFAHDWYRMKPLTVSDLKSKD